MKKALICFSLLLSCLFNLANINAQEQNTISTTINATSQTQEEKQGTVSKVISWYNDNLNYGTITLLMAVESSFIPFPSEVVIPPAAYKASTEEDGLNIVLVVIFGTLGAIIGAIINYVLSLLVGRPIIYKFADSRLGHMLLLSKEKVEKAEKYFVKHGKSSTFIGRLVPAVRQLISIPAGLAKMNLVAFVSFTALGAVIWNSILALLGYLAKGQQDIIEKYSSELSYVLLGLGVLFVAYLIYNGFKKKKTTASEK
ncbi:MAG: DedA family protein [Bacteroidales bacterium]|nr:DedA family protein [Bacteroidales bacterium]